MKLLCLFLGMIFLFLFSCDSTIEKFCGEPKGDEKIFVDALNVKYGGIMLAKPIPCYPGYFQIDLKVEVDSVIINYFDRILRERYVEVLIYDKSKKLIRGNVGSM